MSAFEQAEGLEQVPQRAEERRSLAQRRAYEPPRLAALGDVRTITLGPSSGVGDSAGPTQFKAF